MLSFARAHRGVHVICVKKTGDVHMRVRRLAVNDAHDVKYHERESMPLIYGNVADERIAFCRPFNGLFNTSWIYTWTLCRGFRYDLLIGDCDRNMLFAFTLDDHVWQITQHRNGEIYICVKTNCFNCIYTQSVTNDVYPIERNRIVVDCNRYVLHFHANGKWWTYDMKAVKQIDPSPITIPIIRDSVSELTSITVDHEGNFWALYEQHPMRYELCIYNEQMNLISYCELIANSLKYNARYNTYTLRRQHPRLNRIAYHPSMNKLFIMTKAQCARTYEIDVQRESWSFHTFHHLSCATKKLITSFELSCSVFSVYIPTELRGLIYDFMMTTTHMLHGSFDITGNDRRITARANS